MALTRQQKADQLSDLKKMLKDTKSVMFAHYIGLKVSEVSELRSKLKESKAEMKVAKKTLMRIASKDVGLPEVDEKMLDGAVACILSYDDPLVGAQIAFKFAKDHQQVKLIGGIYDGKVVSADEAVALAKIPSRLQLLGIFAGMLNTPLHSFAIAVSEIAKKKGEPAAPAAEAPKAEAPAAEAPAAEAPKAEEPAAPAAEAPAAPAEPAPETPAA
jgi:large subunit ribosomal protein L10